MIVLNWSCILTLEFHTNGCKPIAMFLDYGLQAQASGVPETSMVGVLVSRGSAAAISFLFPYMLLTVCRNLITMCRETFLNRYIPFDAAIDLHRHMAITAVILSGQGRKIPSTCKKPFRNTLTSLCAT